MDEYLTDFPPVIKHPYKSDVKAKKVDWENLLKLPSIDQNVKEVKWAVPGYTGGICELEKFIRERLTLYESKRNDPNYDALSDLSPWFHFGMISVQRAILEVRKHEKKHKQAVASFMEEAIIRRELADNFCFYNEKYDVLEGANSWAIESLNKHRYNIMLLTYTYNVFKFFFSFTWKI